MLYCRPDYSFFFSTSLCFSQFLFANFANGFISLLSAIFSLYRLTPLIWGFSFRNPIFAILTCGSKSFSVRLSLYFLVYLPEFDFLPFQTHLFRRSRSRKLPRRAHGDFPSCTCSVSSFAFYPVPTIASVLANPASISRTPGEKFDVQYFLLAPYFPSVSSHAFLPFLWPS